MQSCTKTLLYGVFSIFFGNFSFFSVLQWPQKNLRTFFLSKLKVQKSCAKHFCTNTAHECCQNMYPFTRCQTEETRNIPFYIFFILLNETDDYRVCLGFRLMKRNDYFESILTTFKSNIVFSGSNVN